METRGAPRRSGFARGVAARASCAGTELCVESWLAACHWHAACPRPPGRHFFIRGGYYAAAQQCSAPPAWVMLAHTSGFAIVSLTARVFVHTGATLAGAFGQPRSGGWPVALVARCAPMLPLGRVCSRRRAVRFSPPGSRAVRFCQATPGGALLGAGSAVPSASGGVRVPLLRRLPAGRHLFLRRSPAHRTPLPPGPRGVLGCIGLGSSHSRQYLAARAASRVAFARPCAAGPQSGAARSGTPRGA